MTVGKLTFGLFGTGYWAAQTHGPALLGSPHASLRGVWGRDPLKARSVARDLEVEAFEDLDQLLSEVDAVAISLPPDVQAALAVRAAQAGCHLLLDKPLALDADAAERVVDAVASAGVSSVVFFTGRFIPELERWVEEATAAGPWNAANYVLYGNIFQPGNPYAGSPWRREKGALWDVGPHALSFIVPVMGPVTSVTARHGPAGSDTVHLLLTHAPSRGQAVTAASLSLTMPPPATANTLTFYGDKGNFSRPDLVWEPLGACRNTIADLVAMASEGRASHRCDARFGRDVVRILEAAERAIAIPGADVGTTP